MMVRWAMWALLAGSAFGQATWQPPKATEPVEAPGDAARPKSAIAAAVQEGVTAAMAPVVEALRDLKVQVAAMPAPVAPVAAVAPAGPTNPVPWEAVLGALSGIAAGIWGSGRAVSTIRKERGPPRKELAAAVQQQAVQGQPVVPVPVAPPGFRLVPDLGEAQP